MLQMSQSHGGGQRPAELMDFSPQAYRRWPHGVHDVSRFARGDAAAPHQFQHDLRHAGRRIWRGELYEHRRESWNVHGDLPRERTQGHGVLRRSADRLSVQWES